MTRYPELRVGQGFDIHRFSDDPDRRWCSAAACSTASAAWRPQRRRRVAHACADALLGAAGLGDIGMHFPDTDRAWRDADSMTLLRHVVPLLAEDGWRVVNIDCAVVCERPKIAPGATRCSATSPPPPARRSTVKGNRAEQLGALGRGEGLACLRPR